MKTLRIILWKEWTVMLHGYIRSVALFFIVINGLAIYSTWTLLTPGVDSGRLASLMGNTTWFALYTGGGFILLSMLSPVIAKEKYSGHVHNELAYGISFSEIVFGKALFVTLLSLAELPVFAALFVLIQLFGSKTSMQPFLQMLPAALIVYPVLMFLMSSLVTLVDYTKPQLSQVASIAAFGCGFVILSYTRSLIGAMLGMPVILSEVAPSVVLFPAVWLLFKVAERLPNSVLLKG
jgi:hypothetical protein